MSLTSYSEVRPWARAIRDKVISGEMPPWHADPRYGTFRNERKLTTAQIETIERWVDTGATRGDDAHTPVLPTFAEGWQGGEPDYVFVMPVALTSTIALSCIVAALAWMSQRPVVAALLNGGALVLILLMRTGWARARR